MSKAVQLKKEQRDLLQISASELLPKLMAKPELAEARELAFQYWDDARQEEVQVHVAVVRDPAEFIEPFQTVELKNTRQWQN